MEPVTKAWGVQGCQQKGYQLRIQIRTSYASIQQLHWGLLALLFASILTEVIALLIRLFPLECETTGPLNLASEVGDPSAITLHQPVRGSCDTPTDLHSPLVVVFSSPFLMVSKACVKESHSRDVDCFRCAEWSKAYCWRGTPFCFWRSQCPMSIKRCTLKGKDFFGFFLYLLMQYFQLLRIFLCSQMRASHMPLLISSSAVVASDITASSGPCSAILGSAAVWAGTAPSGDTGPFFWVPGGPCLCRLLMAVAKVF